MSLHVRMNILWPAANKLRDCIPRQKDADLISFGQVDQDLHTSNTTAIGRRRLDTNVTDRDLSNQVLRAQDQGPFNWIYQGVSTIDRHPNTRDSVKVPARSSLSLTLTRLTSSSRHQEERSQPIRWVQKMRRLVRSRYSTASGYFTPIIGSLRADGEVK